MVQDYNCRHHDSTVGSFFFVVLLHRVYLEPQYYCQALFAKISTNEKENTSTFCTENWALYQENHSSALYRFLKSNHQVCRVQLRCQNRSHISPFHLLYIWPNCPSSSYEQFKTAALLIVLK